MMARMAFRRVLRLARIAGLALASACSAQHEPPAPALDDGDWRAFAQNFVAPSGRVMDTGNGSISHSEGQGYAMLFAVSAGDEASFRRIWSWTKKHLQIRGDALLAWRWDPETGGVSDPNNATDGDILAAWALLEGAARFDDPALRADALDILNDVKSQLIVPTPFGPALLPGADGFRGGEGELTLNLSYWIFPALARFEEDDDARFWRAVSKTGERLIRKARFGRYALPSDWIVVEARAVAPAGEWPALYGYDAVRIPVYLCLDARLGGAAGARKSLQAPFQRFYEATRGETARGWRVDADRPGEAMPEMMVQALREQLDNACAPAAMGRQSENARLRARAGDSASVYYEAALLLLMRMRGPRQERGFHD